MEPVKVKKAFFLAKPRFGGAAQNI